MKNKDLQYQLTVNPRYLGIMIPLGGFSHCINIGFYFLDEYGIKRYTQCYIPTRLSGVEDGEDSTNSWICDGGRVKCSSLGKVNFYFFYFRYVIRILIFFVIFVFKYDFIDIFHCTFYSGVLKMSDRKAIRSQTREIVGGLNRQWGGY